MFEGVLPVLLLSTQVLLQQAEDVAGLQDTDESGGYDYLILNVLNLKFLLSGAMFGGSEISGVPWVGPAAVQSGSSPEPGGGVR